MYKLVRIKKTQDGFDILLKNKDYKIKLWLEATLKDDDIKFDWKKYNYKQNLVKEILRTAVQNANNEFIDASASALCYLEKYKYITITDDFKIMKGKR